MALLSQWSPPNQAQKFKKIPGAFSARSGAFGGAHPPPKKIVSNCQHSSPLATGDYSNSSLKKIQSNHWCFLWATVAWYCVSFSGRKWGVKAKKGGFSIMCDGEFLAMLDEKIQNWNIKNLYIIYCNHRKTILAKLFISLFFLVQTYMGTFRDVMWVLFVHHSKNQVHSLTLHRRWMPLLSSLPFAIGMRHIAMLLKDLLGKNNHILSMNVRLETTIII